MAAKRFVPTLVGIPEEETSSERCGSANKQSQQRSSTNSVQGSVAKSRKSQRCTGCPGCTESIRNLPALPEADQTNPGESKVRAWLKDVRTPQRKWRDAEDTRRNFQENARTFARSLEYLKELAKRDASTPDSMRTFSSWKDNPPMLRTFQNIARSEILDNDERHSVSKRSTKSMFEDTNRFGRLQRNFDFCGDDTINAKVRKAIENSFIKQMEENAVMESKSKEKVGKLEDEDSMEIRDLNDNVSVKSTTKASPSRKDLPDMINELPGAKNTAKRIMDAVIREMVDVKALDHHPRPSNVNDYEVDSLERSKCCRKSSTSPESTDQSSPALSTALPMDEELTMQNAVINTRTGEMTISKLNKDVLERNYYNNLPELISPQRPENYSLVSEVYVNDGYASPACSDDSGPEIQYEPENPGHLTIKIQDSPENYVKLDESEYEPDTLDRKPMKLRINDDVNYSRDIGNNEVYVDSLERPTQILLRSKGSFRDEDTKGAPLQRGYGSLREIYEARLRANLKESNLMSSTKSLNGEATDSTSWKKCKYLTPDTKQARRQRQPHNQPDVVPMPPTEDIYQKPKPPRRVEDSKIQSSSLSSKNDWDRSPVEAVNPTASNGAPVPRDNNRVGNTDCSCSCTSKAPSDNTTIESWEQTFGNDRKDSDSSVENGESEIFEKQHIRISCKNSVVKCKQRCSTSWKNVVRCRNGSCVGLDTKDGNRAWKECSKRNGCANKPQNGSRIRQCNRESAKFDCGRRLILENRKQSRVEDSGYLSSTDSNGSHNRLLRHEVSSVSETDETESVCDGASESGAESIGTDSVFFGNFCRFSTGSNVAKSVDSGMDLGVRNPYFQPFGIRTDEGVLERTNLNVSDSETESFITVLPPCRSQRGGLVS
ncbi:hypothetical protein KM043_007942 [Ampulex compressa]|nr:hypothetical protein KM043_007942 [Ampulex compressa]